MFSIHNFYLPRKGFALIMLIILFISAWMITLVYRGSEYNMSLTRSTLVNESIYHYELLKNITIMNQESNHTTPRHGWSFNESFASSHYKARYIPFSHIEKGFERRAAEYFRTHPDEDHYMESATDSLEPFFFAGRLRKERSCLSCHDPRAFSAKHYDGILTLEMDSQSYNQNYQLVRHRRTMVMGAIAIAAVALSLLFWYLHIQSVRRKQDEEERKRLMQKMVEMTSQELKSIANSMADGVYILDEHYRLTYINPSGEAILEHTYAEMNGLEPHGLIHFQDRLGNKVPIDACPIHQVFRTGIRYISDEEIFTAKSGRIIPVHLSATPIKDRDTITGVVVVFQDITSRKKSERRLKEYNSRLTQLYEKELATKQEQDEMLLQQAKLAAVGEMIGAIAHQWRQPLNVISLVTQDIQDAWDFKELDQAFLDRSMSGIREQIKFMSETIESFRNLIKPDHEYTKFNLIAATKEMVKMLASQLLSHGISYRINLFLPNGNDINAESYKDLDATLDCPVHGGANEYKQVLLNLMNNAKEALIETKTPHPQIHITLACTEDLVIIRVEDNGPGIRQDILDRLFHPYITSKGEEGTGIGLYVCRKIMEKMSGSIEGENSGHGARFTLRLKKI